MVFFFNLGAFCPTQTKLQDRRENSMQARRKTHLESVFHCYMYVCAQYLDQCGLIIMYFYSPSQTIASPAYPVTLTRLLLAALNVQCET